MAAGGQRVASFEQSADGLEALVPPLFLKDLAVGDVITADLDDEGWVSSWSHVKRSDHSTIWLLRMGEDPERALCLEAVRALGCDTAGSDQLGSYAIDVPGSIPIPAIDDILARLDRGSTAVAFPAMRHSN